MRGEIRGDAAFVSYLKRGVSLLSLAVLGLPAQSSWAAEAAKPVQVASASANSIEEIVVTGVRGKQRTVVTSPAPIDVIPATQFKYTGRAEVGETLARLLPSVNFVTNQAGVTSVVRPVTNRGLGPAYTLVLVNGKRRHNGSQITAGSGDFSGVNPVDYDFVPSSSIERIEVLKDSAAAQYGSDAIAGVVDFQLKRSDHGGHVGVTGGSLYGGQGSKTSWKADADFGFKLPNDGFIHIGADVRHRGAVWWNLAPTNLLFYGKTLASSPKNAAWPGTAAHNGDPKINAQNFYYNAELPVSDSVTLYSFSTVGYRKSEAGNNIRRPNSQASFDVLTPDGYFPVNDISERDLQAVVGAKGDLAGWSWDFSESYGINHAHHSSDLTLNPSLGPTGPTSFDDLATYQFEQWTQNLDVTKGFEIGLAKPLQVSWGFEYRTEKFKTLAGNPDGYRDGGYVYKAGDQFDNPNVGKRAFVGAQSSFTIRPSEEANATRNVVAGYLDLGLYPVEKWYVGIAGRAEHYDDSSGNTVSGKLNSRYDITSNLAVRGTVGSGFRAPSLTQLYYAYTDNRTALIGGVAVPSYSVLARNNSALARILGAQDLKPEKSQNFGLGFVWTPVKSVNITLDAYQVKIKHRIIRTDTLGGPNVDAALIANGYTGVGLLPYFVTYFANAVDTRTRGLDLVIDTRQDIGKFGVLGLNAALNVNKTVITNVANAPAALGTLSPGLFYFGRLRQGELTVGNPQTKLILTGHWTLDRLDVNLQTTRYGPYTYWRSQSVAQDVHYTAKWLTDVDVSYALTDNLRVSVGAVNVFDVRPDLIPAVVDANTGAGPYGPSPYSPAGGYYYGRASFDF